MKPQTPLKKLKDKVMLHDGMHGIVFGEVVGMSIPNNPKDENEQIRYLLKLFNCTGGFSFHSVKEISKLIKEWIKEETVEDFKTYFAKESMVVTKAPDFVTYSWIDEDYLYTDEQILEYEADKIRVEVWKKKRPVRSVPKQA